MTTEVARTWRSQGIEKELPMPESVDEEMRARLGARVRELRVARGWSMQDLGDVTGCTRSYISQIEQGKITLPTRITLLRLAEALNTSPEDLLWAAGYRRNSEQNGRAS